MRLQAISRARQLLIRPFAGMPQTVRGVLAHLRDLHVTLTTRGAALYYCAAERPMPSDTTDRAQWVHLDTIDGPIVSTLERPDMPGLVFTMRQCRHCGECWTVSR